MAVMAVADTANNRVTQEWRMTGTHTGEGFPPGVPPTGRAFELGTTTMAITAMTTVHTSPHGW